VDANGIITTVAGNGGPGYGGDGGAATNAKLNKPASLAFDAAGNLYIADWYNNRIREVHFSGYPSSAPTNSFVLPEVTATNAGNYSVIITSPYGSVTSSVATLTITVSRTPPEIVTHDASFGFNTNQFGFNLTAAFDQTIVVDTSTDLINWTPLFTNVIGGTHFYFSDSVATNFPSRFYRARLP
jgi:hypothetical protein